MSMFTINCWSFVSQVPFKYIPKEVEGLAAIPSFGIGALVAGIVVTLAYWKLFQKEPFPKLQGDQIGAGLASGLIWNAGSLGLSCVFPLIPHPMMVFKMSWLSSSWETQKNRYFSICWLVPDVESWPRPGNVCSVIAQSPPFSLPYGVAYPILQCALFFGGLWGIYAFKEITGRSIYIFWAGGDAFLYQLPDFLIGNPFKPFNEFMLINPHSNRLQLQSQRFQLPLVAGVWSPGALTLVAGVVLLGLYGPGTGWGGGGPERPQCLGHPTWVEENPSPGRKKWGRWAIDLW